MTRGMDYSLAKRLKEAGFPQMRGGNGEWWWGKTGVSAPYQMPHYDDKLDETRFCIYIPTLEELIEACDTKGGVFSLYSYMDGWAAQITGANINTGHFCGKTRSEAVANLWLSLHEKQP